jgi:hypothetical protein
MKTEDEYCGKQEADSDPDEQADTIPAIPDRISLLKCHLVALRVFGRSFEL